MPEILGLAGRRLPRGRATAAPGELPAEMADAFASLYAGTASPLWRYLFRTCGSAVLADDLVQESFLRLLRKAERLADPEAARPYLYRIASNLLKDRWRSKKRHERLAPSPRKAEVASHAAPAQLSNDVQAVLGKLSERERALVWLALVDGYAHGEIAHILGLRRSSIKVLLHRAKKKLRCLLEEGGYSPGSRS